MEQRIASNQTPDANRPDRGASELNCKVGQITDPVVLPVVEEQVEVTKRAVESGRVRVQITPTTRHEVIDVPVAEERLEVERVAVNRFVERAEPAREEGDVTIVPVYEEVVVVERRLRLKEEIRIHRRRTQRQERHEIDLRSEEVRIDRTGPDEGASGRSAGRSDAGPRSE